MNALCSAVLCVVAIASAIADEPKIITYGPCLDDGSCPMPYGVCWTESFECVGIDDPSRLEEFNKPQGFDFESNPQIVEFGPCLDDGSCPMANAICLTEAMSCVGVEGFEVEEVTQLEQPMNVTGSVDFEDIEASFAQKVSEEMEPRVAAVFSMKTEL